MHNSPAARYRKGLVQLMKLINKKSACLILWVIAEYFAAVERNHSPGFNAYIKEKFSDVDNVTILFIGELPEGILVISILSVIFITIGYVLLKYVLLHPKLFPIIKITSGLFFLGLYFWILEGLYYHTVEMIKWNFYFSVVPEFILTAYFTIVLLEVCRLLQIRLLINNIMK